VTTLRNQFKMVRGLAGAQPNTNSSETPPDAGFDTGSYSDALDDDAQFVHAPTRRENSVRLVTGGVAGLFAGNGLTNPVYNDALNGYTGVEQKLTKAEANDLRDAGVIPIRQEGSIRVADNTSTSSATDWERDFFTRRVVDQVILVAKQIGDSIIGRRNTEQTRNIAEASIRGNIENFVEDGLLRPNTDDDQRWYVDAYPEQNDTNKVNIDIGVTPVGVVKIVDETITIET